jgi:hypothetical protein
LYEFKKRTNELETLETLGVPWVWVSQSNFLNVLKYQFFTKDGLKNIDFKYTLLFKTQNEECLLRNIRNHSSLPKIILYILNRTVTIISDSIKIIITFVAVTGPDRYWPYIGNRSDSKVGVDTDIVISILNKVIRFLRIVSEIKKL